MTKIIHARCAHDVAKIGQDYHFGVATIPPLTIQAAANLAQLSDIVSVHGPVRI